VSLERNKENKKTKLLVIFCSILKQKWSVRNEKDGERKKELPLKFSVDIRRSSRGGFTRISNPVWHLSEILKKGLKQGISDGFKKERESRK